MAVDGLALPICAKGRGTANAAGLRVRSAPETGTILGSLRLDEAVTVWALDGGWAIVQTDDGAPDHPERARLTGWASAAYLVLGELVP